MMDLAEKIYDAVNESTPKQLKPGEWHIPFENKMDIPSEDYIKITGKVMLKSEDFTKIKVKASVAMAARTSYTIVGEEKGLPDGLKVDNHGNLFATGPGGVWIISPDGEHMGTIKTEEATSNCAFNEDQSVLYITADMYLMRIRIK